MLRKIISLFGKQEPEDRRRLEAYWLRVYHEQIQIVEAMSQADWVEQWLNSEMQYMPKDIWLAYLKECALYESKKIAFMHVNRKYAA